MKQKTGGASGRADDDNDAAARRAFQQKIVGERSTRVAHIEKKYLLFNFLVSVASVALVCLGMALLRNDGAAFNERCPVCPVCDDAEG